MRRVVDFSWIPLTLTLAYALTPVRPASGQTAPKVTPLPDVPAARSELPPGAGSHRGEEYRKQWKSLSSKERKEILEVFRSIVGPEIQKAYEQSQKEPPNARGAGLFTGSRAWCEETYYAPCGGGQFPPEVGASAFPTTGAAPLSVDFSAYAYDSDGWIADSYWDFGDGGWSPGLYASHIYYSPGWYPATVYVSDDSGLSASSTIWINVTGGGGNQPPEVSASASPLAGTAPLQVTLNASGSDPDGTITSWSWSFGDGTGASGPTVFHTYGSAGNFVATVTVTDNQGATASSSIAVQVQPPISGNDDDGDGLADEVEKQLSDHFTPAYSVSFFEFPGTGLSLFQDRPDAQVPTQVFPTPTVTSYYRVTPLGVVGGQSYLQVDYLTLWNRDDGLAINGACGSDIDLLDFFGIWSPAFGTTLFGHPLDQERSAVRLVAPAVGGGHNPDPNAYRLDRFFTAAHEDTETDRSDLYPINPPQGPEAHYGLFLSLSKHGTYGYWPYGVSLLPGWAVGSIYGGVFSACYFWPDWCDLLWWIADEVVYDCITEKHVHQGWVLAREDLRINVGETNRPLPGGRFIQSQPLIDKLQKRFVIP